MLQLVGSAAILAAILFLLFQSFARELAVQSQDTTLLASASAILESVSVQQGEVVADIPYAALAMLGNVSDDRVFYQISQGTQVLTGYDDLPPNAAALTSWTADYRGAPIRLVQVSRSLPINGSLAIIAVTVAQTQDGLALTLSEISATAIQIGAIFFAVATVLAIWTARSSVRPLNTVADAVSRRGPTDLRPVTTPVPAEMAPLTRALNDFIARLDRSLSQSEDFITEAAHRVRTPLATVRAQAEVTLRRVDREENRASLKQMIRAVDESSRAAGQLLDHAMVTFRTDTLAQSQINLGAVLDEIVERQSPLANLKDIQITQTTDPDCIVQGDPILIQNAVTNIIDNAIKYSPHETCVAVKLARNATRITLTVIDQGPGFEADNINTLTDRFARGTNVGQTVGSGLGLTIASEVVKAHKGTLTLTQRTDGDGACVTISLPA